MSVGYSLGRMAVRVVWTIAVTLCIWGFGTIAADAAALPDGRGYELVSPPDKNGGDVLAESFRTRASADGNALAFASLVGFGDARGSGVTVDYLAQRRPETGGWVTHAITPTVLSGTVNDRGAGADALFQALSPDLAHGVFSSMTPVEDVGNVRDVGNLYMRDDVLRAGAGSYALMTGCPACDATNTPLPPAPGVGAILQQYFPRFAGASTDVQHVMYESIYDLTSDAPAQTGFCGDANFIFPPPSPAFCATRVYEWDGGAPSLAGRVPVLPATECDDAGAGPACVPADMSVAGVSARHFQYTPHVVSDGSDGHTRVMFTQPTASNGSTFSQQGLFGQISLVLAAPTVGNVFMRIDHSQTVQLNASERTGGPDAFAPAKYLDASVNGERVFFMTSQALTDDATPGAEQIYMYDTAATPHHLTLLTPNAADDDLMGVSDDGHYAYLSVNGEMMLWHDGTLQDIGTTPGSNSSQFLFVDGRWSGFYPLESRVTPDGRHLLFISDRAPRPGGYDHGTCSSGFGCRELYVYSADTDTVQCVSCNPSGARPTVDATVNGSGLVGGSQSTSYMNRAISDDGTYVFFNSREALVPEAVNGRMNAYEYDTVTGRVSLLSTGTSASDSFFMDASANGSDAFIATRDQLVGWDRDSSYDMYDARIGGGLPEPPPPSAGCSGGTCQGALPVPPAYAAPGSPGVFGAGNANGTLRARARRVTCRRGFVKRTVKGKQKCVKVRRARARKARRASSRSRVARQTRSGR